MENNSKNDDDADDDVDDDDVYVKATCLSIWFIFESVIWFGIYLSVAAVYSCFHYANAFSITSLIELL